MPETTPVIWGQTSNGQDAYVHSCTKAVYDPETGKTLDEEMVTMQDSPADITGETTIKPVCDASGNVICPQTRTAAVYDPKSGQTLDKVLGEEKLKLLWTNPNPTSSFVSQTVPLDLSQYELFLVTVMDTNDSDGTYRELSFLAFKNVLSTMQSVFVGGYGPGVNNRPFQILENGVNFSDARRSYNNQNYKVFNSTLIPHKIYGIKL